MAVSQKIHKMPTKYFTAINQSYYVINLQNIKFVQLIVWPEGAYTDDAYATTAVIMIPYYDSIHESRLYRLIMAMPNEPKTLELIFRSLFFLSIYKGKFVTSEGV